MEKTSQVELFGGTELGTVEKSSSIKGTVNTGIESFFWPGTERFEKFRLSWNCKTPDDEHQFYLWYPLVTELERSMSPSRNVAEYLVRDGVKCVGRILVQVDDMGRVPRVRDQIGHQRPGPCRRGPMDDSGGRGWPEKDDKGMLNKESFTIL